MIKIKFSVINAKRSLTMGLLWLLTKIAKPSDIIWNVSSFVEMHDGEMKQASTVQVDRYDLAEWLFIDGGLPEGVDRVQITSVDKDKPEKPSRWNEKK